MISLEESLQPLSKKQRLDTMNGTEHGSVAVSDSMTQCTICGHISCRASQLIESECHPKIQPKIKEFLTKNDIQCPKLIFGEQDNEWIVAAANLNCLLCDLKTNSVSELRLHLSNHDCSPISFSGLVNPMKYECKLCTSFVREDAFDRHKDNHVAKDEQFQVVELGDRVVLYGINIRKEKPLSISFQSTFKPVSLEKKIEAETRDVVKKPIRKIEMSSDESSSSSSNESNDSDFDSTSNSDSNDDDYNEKMESQQITKPSRRIAKVVYGECGTCGKLCNAERELQEVGITIHNSKYQNQRCFNSRSGCDNFSYYKQDEKWSVAAVNCSCGLCSHAARSYKAIAEHVFEEHGITIMHYTLLLEPKKCVCNLCHRYIPFKERDGHLKYHLRKQSDYKRVKLMQINGEYVIDVFKSGNVSTAKEPLNDAKKVAAEKSGPVKVIKFTKEEKVEVPHQYACRICNLVYEKTAFERHLERHEENRDPIEVSYGPFQTIIEPSQTQPMVVPPKEEQDDSPQRILLEGLIQTPFDFDSQCKICSQYFSNKVELRLHYVLFHQIKSSVLSTINAKLRELKMKQYPCSFCKWSFYDLASHVEHFHKFERDQEIQGIVQFASDLFCVQCDDFYDQIEDFKAHLVQFHSVEKDKLLSQLHQQLSDLCDLCGTKIKDEPIHIQTHHKIPIDSCTSFYNQFRNKLDFDTKCVVCQVSFGSHNSLLSHYLEYHQVQLSALQKIANQINS